MLYWKHLSGGWLWTVQCRYDTNKFVVLEHPLREPIHRYCYQKSESNWEYTPLSKFVDLFLLSSFVCFLWFVSAFRVWIKFFVLGWCALHHLSELYRHPDQLSWQRFQNVQIIYQWSIVSIRAKPLGNVMYSNGWWFVLTQSSIYVSDNNNLFGIPKAIREWRIELENKM